MPEKILQLCSHDTPPFADLISLFAEAAQSLGAEVTNVFLSHPGAVPVAGADYLGLDNLADTSAISHALATYAQQQWSLVLCHRYRSYWSAVRSPLPNERCVVLAHEFDLLKRWQRRLNRLLFARRVKFAGVSQPVADELAAITGHALLLPNGLHTALCRRELLEREAARAALQLPQDACIVGVVGRLHYKKRPMLALQAFQHFTTLTTEQAGARADRAPAHLVFLGTGDAQTALREQVTEQADSAARVHFLGQVQHARRYLRAFDALLYPAATDSFGMVALEALDAGVPVVCKPRDASRHGPGYVLGDLGAYAQSDDAPGFAAALRGSLQADTTTLLQQGQQRVDQHFSVAAVARALDDVLICVGKKGALPQAGS